MVRCGRVATVQNARQCRLKPRVVVTARKVTFAGIALRLLNPPSIADLATGTVCRTRLQPTAAPGAPPDDRLLGDVARAVDAERQCCRFLSFTIIVNPDGGPITLDLTGPEGTREFLAAILGA